MDGAVDSAGRSESTSRRGASRPLDASGVARVDDVTEILRREQRLLDSLLFRLTEIRSLAAEGEARFLAWAAADVERAAEAVRECELRRASAVQRAQDELGAVGDVLTLAELIDRAPEPYGNVLAEHGVALRRVVDEIEAVATDGRELAEAGLARVAAEQAAMNASGGGDADLTGMGLDLEMADLAYSAALVAVSWFPLPALRDFLA